MTEVKENLCAESELGQEIFKVKLHNYGNMTENGRTQCEDTKSKALIDV